MRELAPEVLPQFELTVDERWASASLAPPEVRLKGTEPELRTLFEAARRSHQALVRAAEAGRPTPVRVEPLPEATRGGAVGLTEALRL